MVKDKYNQPKKNSSQSRKSTDKKSTRKGTDALLKIILDFFLPEFTQLALGDKFKVLDAKLLDKEKFRVQKPKKHEMDALIETWVEDKTGVQMKRRLHLEFQGLGSHQDMAVRILGYFSVMSEAEGTLQIPIDIVVFYINGAGKKDTGHHILGDPAIGEFNYHVIHLDAIDAEEILESDNLLLLCLIGLSKLKNAEEEVKRAYHKIVELSPKEDLVRYVGGLMMLLLDNSLIESLEEIMPTSLLMDTPYMLRLERVKQENYALGLAEGEAKGITKGITEGEARGEARGKAEGKAEGLEEGKKMIRGNISEIVRNRFELRLKEITALHEQLQKVDDYTALSIVLQKAIIVDSFANFMTWLVETNSEGVRPISS